MLLADTEINDDELDLGITLPFASKWRRMF
jgi:hypothetical protein